MSSGRVDVAHADADESLGGVEMGHGDRHGRPFWIDARQRRRHLRWRSARAPCVVVSTRPTASKTWSAPPAVAVEHDARATRRRLATVERLGRAELLDGSPPALRIEVDGDDLGRSGGVGGLHDVQPHAAAPDHDHRVAALAPGRRARRRRTRWPRRSRAVRPPRRGIVSGTTTTALRWTTISSASAPTLVNWWSGVCRRTSAGSAASAGRIVAARSAHRAKLAAAAPTARPAVDHETDHDVVADGDAVDVATDLGDDA